MSARAQVVLGRFPRHVAATDPGKRFAALVGGLADPLDVLTGQVGAVRAGHRLAEAPTVGDLLALARLHGLGVPALALLERRLAALAVAAAGGVGGGPDAEAIAALVNVAGAELEALGDDLAPAARRAAWHRPALRLRRRLVGEVVATHLVGNGTAAAVLRAAAAYLSLEVREVLHTEERWWHLARCADAVRVAPPGRAAPPEPAADLLALEENPFRPADIEPTPRRHGQRFRVLRAGLQDVDVAVRVRGVGARTLRPAVVHVEEGRGLAFEGTVPDGAELRFTVSGRATLESADVTGSAWSFSGGVFASEDEPLGADFVFADAASSEAHGDREATFSVTAPLANAFEPAAGFPHGAPGVAPLRLARGRSHFVALARLASFGMGSTPAIPRTSAGRFDASVLADAAGPPEPSFEVGFSWEEREPFAARVLVPQRFGRLDDDRGTELREPLRVLLDRHRAAGVDVRVEYADPRWTLGEGVVRDTVEEPLGTVIAGTRLWTDPAREPDA